MEGASACPTTSSESSSASSSPTLPARPSKLADTVDGGPKRVKKGGKQSTTPKTFRFTPATDIDLLKIAVHVQPWAAGHGKKASIWATITETFQEAVRSTNPLVDKVTPTAVQRRFDNLVTCFKQEEMESLKASGTEEEYDERTQLLTEIVDLMREYEEGKKERMEKEKAEIVKKEQMGETIMRAAVTGMVKTKRRSLDSSETAAITVDSDMEDTGGSSESTKDRGNGSRAVQRKRRRSETPSSSAEVLREFLMLQDTSNASDSSLEERRLALDERRLAMEEKKVQMAAAREEKNSQREMQLFAMMNSVLTTLAELKK
ncbi:hypothetical protein HDU96_008237 [Phlyctochytrium bullatum]|nr:hypothetical protein HDU96_008237 [Phlyctochytrium bullatum]